MYRFHANQTPSMANTPPGTPIPIVILSDVAKPLDDTLPLSLEGAVDLDDASIEVGELVIELVIA